jgi:hypothetical protein
MPVKALEKDRVLYHSPFEASGDEENQLVYGERQGSSGSYRVLYHVFLAPQGLFFLPLTPLLDIPVPASKITGIPFAPVTLGQLLTGFPTHLSKTGLLPLSQPWMRVKIPSTEKTSLDHLWPPRRIPLRDIVQGEKREERRLFAE